MEDYKLEKIRNIDLKKRNIVNRISFDIMNDLDLLEYPILLDSMRKQLDELKLEYDTIRRKLK